MVGLETGTWKEGEAPQEDQVDAARLNPGQAKVLTPYGWVAMTQLRTRDAIVDPDGGIGYIERIITNINKNLYRLETRSGATTICGDESPFTVQTYTDKAKKTGKWHSYNIQRMLRKDGIIRTNKNGSRMYKFFLPKPVVTDFAPSVLPIPAYTLGVLLGDGDITRSVSFASIDEDIVARVASEAPEQLRIVEYSNSISWGISSPGGRGSRKGLTGYSNNPYLNALRELNLAGTNSFTKFIPELYLRSSIADRIALLQGLMDTDGTHNISNNRPHFISTSSCLAKNVAELVRSLGGLASIGGPYVNKYTHQGVLKDGSPYWSIGVRLPVCPFYLPRKAVLWSPVMVHSPIKSIELIGKFDFITILVSTKRHLYITDDYIVRGE